MEDLNKTQLILLALLLSFITSIATGIVTVTLLDQAPPAVTQTINRVVKETVREVIPQTPTPVTPQTIIVKEEDFIVDATKKTSPNIVEVGYFKKKTSFGLSTKEEAPTFEFLGTGFAIVPRGVIVADRAIYDPNKQLFAKTQSGIFYELTLLGQNDGTGLGFFESGLEFDATGKAVTLAVNATPIVDKFPVVNFGDSDKLLVGQTAIALGTKNGLHLLLGVISRIEVIAVPKDGGKPEETVNTNSIVYTSIGYDAKFVGGPLVKSDGQVVGINFIAASGERYTIPSNVVRNIFADVEKKVNPQAEAGETTPESNGPLSANLDTTQN